MIDGIKVKARQLPTPGIISLAARPALARQAVVDARKAEGEGRPGDAVDATTTWLSSSSRRHH